MKIYHHTLELGGKKVTQGLCQVLVRFMSSPCQVHVRSIFWHVANTIYSLNNPISSKVMTNILCNC